MKESDYISLLDRFMSGEVSPEEEVSLREWINNPESADALHCFYLKRWQEAQHSGIPRDIQERMFVRIQSDISKKRRPIRIQWRRIMQYAAVVALCISIGFMGSQLFIKNEMAQQIPVEVKEYRVTAEKGQRANVTLPDGTEVWLNSHTQLTYSTNYGIENRKVSLVGEAFFEVAKDSLKRFIVDAGEMEIEALGTSFNVKAYSEDAKTTTTLLTGRVKVSAGEDEYILSPNQYSSFDRVEKKMSMGEAVDVSHARMWLNNELVFNGETMSEIAVILNRLSNVHVKITSERIKKYKFSGVIKNNSLGNIIELISLTAPIIYKSEGDTIVLGEKP